MGSSIARWQQASSPNCTPGPALTVAEHVAPAAAVVRHACAVDDLRHAARAADDDHAASGSCSGVDAAGAVVVHVQVVRQVRVCRGQRTAATGRQGKWASVLQVMVSTLQPQAPAVCSAAAWTHLVPAVLP